MGRPPIPKAQQKRITLSVRLTAAEKHALDAQAKTDKTKLSTWARDALLRFSSGPGPSKRSAASR